MRERPILFQGAMVRGILDESKTMTRRIAKGMPGPGGYRIGDALIGPGGRPIKAPYGLPGDRLWVREAWRAPKKLDGLAPRELYPRTFTLFYEAGGHAANYENGWEVAEDEGPLPDWRGKLRPSMFMPRWASRLTLEITDVRVERLQDISEADAIAEGIEPDVQPGDAAPLWRNYLTGGTTISPVYSYETLWDSINGPGSWAANPWVWVVEFRKLP